MKEVYAVNVPDGWGDITYEIELRSGRKIEFIPDFHPPEFFQQNNIPANVRRFQPIIKIPGHKGLLG